MNEIIASVDRLSRLQPNGRRILSVYLDTDPSRGPGRNLKAQVREVLQGVKDGSTDDPAALEVEIESIQSVIEALPERPRGLAVFTSQALGLNEVLPLPVAPEPGARWARRLNLRPLLSLLDQYEPTLIILVDKEHARLFRWVLDAVEEIDWFEDDVPGKNAKGGEAQANRQRHHDELVLQHVRRAVEMLTRHIDGERIRRIAIGGPAEVLAHLRRLLPAAIADRVTGVINVRVTAPIPEVLDAAREVRESWERDEEKLLVSSLEESRGRSRAVVGPQDVIEAVREQRVRTLVYASRAAVPGGRCRSCETLYADPAPDVCHACGNQVERMDDLLDLLASRVLHAGGGIDEVRGPAADSLQAYAGIAANLLYPLPAERSA
jgi:peptide subunit release factor 1 (eRF1)